MILQYALPEYPETRVADSSQDGEWWSCLWSIFLYVDTIQGGR